MKESQIQKQILDYLRLRGCLVFKHRNVGIWKQKTNSYIPLSYGEKGISDIIGLTNKGRFLALEVKRKGNKPTQEQLDFIARVKQKKGIGAVVYSLDDVINAIK